MRKLLTKIFRNQSGVTSIEYALKDATGGFAAGAPAVAFFAFLSAVLVLILGRNPALERSVAPAE